MSVQWRLGDTLAPKIGSLRFGRQWRLTLKRQSIFVPDAISVAINEAAISVDIVKLDAVLHRWVITLGFASILKKVKKTEMKNYVFGPPIWAISSYVRLRIRIVYS